MIRAGMRGRVLAVFHLVGRHLSFPLRRTGYSELRSTVPAGICLPRGTVASVALFQYCAARHDGT